MIWSWLQPLSTDSGTGIDPGTFWLIVSALGGALTTVSSLLYKTERDRRIAAERKLEKFTEIAPDLSENVRWLVEEAQDRIRPELPWAYGRTPARSVNPRRRR